MLKYPFTHADVQAAFMRSFTKDVEGRAEKLRSGFISESNTLHFRHGLIWESPANEFGDKRGELQQHSAKFRIDYFDIVLGKTEIIEVAAQKLTQEMHDQIQRMLFDTMSRSTEESGNVVDGRGKPMTEVIYEALEKIQISVDRDGNLNMPQVMIGATQFDKVISELEGADALYKERLDLLIARKKEEAQEREKDRLARFERREV